MAPVFIRQDYMRYIKLGKHRKKLLKWRRPRGRHSKMRKQRKGYPVSPGVGYKNARVARGKLENLTPILINNMKDLERTGKDHILIISKRIGAKKKMDLLKKASEMKLRIFNLPGGNNGSK